MSLLVGGLIALAIFGVGVALGYIAGLLYAIFAGGGRMGH